MALRIRKNGMILCAALHDPEPGDTYINDDLHYQMSVIHKVIVTDPMPKHAEHGEWWWAGGKATIDRRDSRATYNQIWAMANREANDG